MKIWKKENFLKAVENEVKTWEGTGLKGGVTYLWVYNSLKFKATDKKTFKLSILVIRLMPWSVPGYLQNN